MERLTKKVDNYGYGYKGPNYLPPMELKLGQLEDIEEKYNINLIYLLQAIDNGAYFIHMMSNFQKEIVFSNSIRILDFIDGEYFLNKGKKSKDSDNYTWQPFRIELYGKTWALTKEELQDELN